MIEKVLKIVSVIGISTVKHTLGGIPLSVGFGFNFLETFLSTFIGGSIGVVIFMFASDKVAKMFAKRNGTKKTKKKFTRMNRIIIRLKRGIGIWGIAIMTPVILSIPVGAIVATKFYGANKKTLTIMIIGVAIVSFLGALLADEIANFMS